MESPSSNIELTGFPRSIATLIVVEWATVHKLDTRNVACSVQNRPPPSLVCRGEPNVLSKFPKLFF